MTPLQKIAVDRIRAAGLVDLLVRVLSTRRVTEREFFGDSKPLARHPMVVRAREEFVHLARSHGVTYGKLSTMMLFSENAVKLMDVRYEHRLAMRARRTASSCTE